MSAADDVKNDHSPPSSAEEAAALVASILSSPLLDASFAFDTTSTSASASASASVHHPNPPQGMHSIFTVQTPVPNQALFVRLVNLRAWLRWHADALEDSNGALDEFHERPIDQHLGISFPSTKRNQSKEPFLAARSILAVLMKLLEASSAIATGDMIGGNGHDDPASKVVKAIPSPSPKHAKHAPHLPHKTTKQHKHLPPLLSTPIRNVWVECISLCLALGCSLPGKMRIDVYAFLGKMMEISSWNPRSKMAAGGVRLAALEVMGQACISNIDLAKRTAPYAWDILQCCHKGLLSGGAGEPGHRAACVKTACNLLVACRRATNNGAVGRGSESFAIPGALEEKVAVEAIKFIKKATSDKFPEVRMGAAVFAGLAAPLLIRIVPVAGAQRGGIGKDADGSPLSWVEDVTQIAMRNIDDESAGVATAWSATLARCLCASAEYGASVRSAQSANNASNRSADVGDEAVSHADSSSLDLAAKLKAFSDARRATSTTAACSSVPSAIVYLASQFVKTGGETVSSKCGGPYSIGGRASRIGFADSLTKFLCLQAAKSDFPLVHALDLVLEMVGASFDKQIRKKEGTAPPISNDMEFYAPASPRSPHDKRAPTPSLFSPKNTKAKSTSDSSIGRMLASNVVRRGLSENVSESSQLKILRELISACRSSVSSASDDGGNSSVVATETNKGKLLNRHQLQVALIEISHLIVALGEAGASSLEDLLPVLRDSLSYADHGVRHEAAAAYASVAQSFPNEGRLFVIESLGTFGANLDAIQSLCHSSQSVSPSSPVLRSRFRLTHNTNTGDSELMKNQSSLHGNALAVSMLLHEFPHVKGVVATAIVSKVFDVIGKLLSCQFNDAFIKSNPSVVCTCIRAGYCMLSGALSMGIDAIVPHHVTTVFTFWQKSSSHMIPGVSKFTASQDLLWVESMLASVVSFLKFSPQLLLAVPDALSRLTVLLEKVFPLTSKGGRFDSEYNDPVGSTRLSSARSSILEAYSWLPPGSYPMSADRIFSFATSQIQELSGNDVLCSILDSMVSSEDKLLEAHSTERAVSPGQVCGSVALDTNISLRSSDIIHHNEREAVLHLLAWKKRSQMHTRDNILSFYLRSGDENAIPTALHEVGTWRVPQDPTGTSNVRLLDSSIHVFAATFGLQDGHTQSEALKVLESVYLTAQTEKSNRFNVGTSLIAESQGRVKPIEEDVASSNVIATVLACLRALPVHESTHDTLIDRGPPWMERATSLLLRLLPSPSDNIRRGAAESLSLLATLGVSEDAHTLQSTILYSLDEVMKGSGVGTSPKTHLETLGFAKAGSLLALASIQRAAKRMKRSEEERAVLRSVSREVHDVDDKTPVMIMMTRVLPSLATQNPEADSLLARTCALHAFGLLISNSISTEVSLSPEQIQILWKAVESVETSFLGAWSAIVSENSGGKEREKFASSPAFNAVLLRLMTTLLPWLGDLKTLDRWVASRFSCYASTVLEYSSHHPAIFFEGSVFFERLRKHQDLLGPNSNCVVTTDNVAVTAMPFLITVLRPTCSNNLADTLLDYSSCRGSIEAQRSVILCLKGIFSSSKRLDQAFTFEVGKAILSFMHELCGRRKFQHFSEFRSLALSRAVVNVFDDYQMLEMETIEVIQVLFNAQLVGRAETETHFIILRWLLFARCLASGDATFPQTEVDSHSNTTLSPAVLVEKAKNFARADASTVLKYSNPPRWQLKVVSANALLVAMLKLLAIDKDTAGGSFLFNLKSAQMRCIEMLRKENTQYGVDLHTLPIFHLEELIATSCNISTSTSNHSELPTLQASGLKLLVTMVHAFGKQLDSSTNDGTSVLEQYSSQIVSSVKHALNAENLAKESVPGTAFHHLFAAGCEALFAMISHDVISDPMVFRRLLQPVSLVAAEMPFAQFPDGDGDESDALLMSTSHVTDDIRSYPLFRLSKLCFLAKASMLPDLGNIEPSTVSMLANELKNDEIGKPIQYAATAIDGFLLHETQQNECSPRVSGLTYKNIADLDESVIQMMIENWPTLSAAAISSIINASKFRGNESDESKTLKKWVAKLAPVVVSGLRRALSDNCSHARRTSAILIFAIRIIIRGNEYLGDEFLCSVELGDIANAMTESVVFKACGLTSTQSNSERLLVDDDGKILIHQSCGLIEDLCQQHHVGVDSTILTRAVVTPLVALQDNRMMVESDDAFITTSCLRSSLSLLQYHPEKGRGEFEKALVQLVLALLVRDSSERDEDVKAECLLLLRSCCEKTTMSHDDWGQISSFTACNGMWDAWAIICSTLPLGYGIMCSIGAIKTSLGDLNSCPRHTAALVALRIALQSAGSENPSLLCYVMRSVGYEILQLFRAHALRLLDGKVLDDNRTTVCAESIKVNLMAFQYLSSSSEEEGNFVSFISTLFEVLVESISFNGMPNNPSGNAGADESIGRMCAQVFVHVARTSPMIFKSAMPVISPDSRTILESAVRADMSGYAKADTKRKISLKGFVSSQ